MHVPWIITVLPLTVWSGLREMGLGVWGFLRNFGLWCYHGPSYFCWHADCWNPVSLDCRATAKTGNGRMCAEHCVACSYHGKRTGCGEIAAWAAEGTERLQAGKSPAEVARLVIEALKALRGM